MSWERAIKFTLPWEGGFTNNPLDRGGPTNMGITQGTLDAAFKKKIVGHNNVRALSKDEALRIYRTNYWDAHGWGKYAESVDMIMFDICVNHGMCGAAKIAQRACVSCGADLVIDGKWGPKTAAALFNLAWSNALYLSKMLIIKRLNYYDKIVEAKPDQKVFLGGWCRRTRALAVAAGIKM